MVNSCGKYVTPFLSHYTSYYGVVMTCVIDTLNLDRTRAPIMEASCDVILAVLSEHAGPDYEPVESDGLW